MKTIFIRLLLLFALLPQLLRAQSWAMERFFEQHAKEQGVCSVSFERKMMQMMSEQARRQGDQKQAELLDDIRFIRILTVKEGDGEALAAAAEKAVNRNGAFEPISSSSNGGQSLQFYLNEWYQSSEGRKGSAWKELVMISHGPRETVVLHLFGNFNLHDISGITSFRP